MMRGGNIIYLCLLLVLGFAGAAFSAPITIDGDFRDWVYEDLIALDQHFGMTLGSEPAMTECYPIPESPVGEDTTYLILDWYDDSRDIAALYWRDEDPNVFFRVDFFDLKAFAEEAGGLDLYIVLDFKSGGSEWLPDYVDCKTDHPWETAICVYDTNNCSVKKGDADQTEIADASSVSIAFQGELDSVELGIPREILTANGWDGHAPFAIQCYTTKDGTNGEDGELGGTGEGPQNSDITDAIADDDRGWSDGSLDGATMSDAPRPGRVKWVALMHGNQSFNPEPQIQARLDKRRDPLEPVEGVGFYRTLDTHERWGLPVELHLSGCLTTAVQWADPEFNERIKRLAEEGIVDLVGGVYAEHIMPFFKGDVNEVSIDMGTRVIEEVYGVSRSDLRVFWMPERITRGDIFEDITNANAKYGTNYQAAVLDENTAHHDWFGWDNVWDGNPDTNVQVDLDKDEHKPHLINGVWVFFIDRYAQQWKIEMMTPTFYDCVYEASPQIGLRGRMLWFAMHADQEQVMVCMEDWEDWVGEPYKATPNRRNPDGHEIVTRYIANHPWILQTTLTRIMRGEVDVTGDGVGDQWRPVEDVPLTSKLPPNYGLDMPPYWLKNTLPITQYAWVRDSAEGNSSSPERGYPSPTNVDNDPRNDRYDEGYQNWYYGSNYEYSFFSAVPAIRGWRYGKKAEFLPNNKRYGGMWEWSANGAETPCSEGIIPETWARIAGSSGDAELVRLAQHVFMAMLYETAWHDEHSAAALSGDTDLDDSKGVLVDWVLPAAGHIREANIIVEAAEWAVGSKPEKTVAEARDVDMDGEDEFLLYNSRVFAVFENDGGRLIHAYSLDAQSGKYMQVVGSSLAHPDNEGEEENVDAFVAPGADNVMNRCSAFRDQNYVNEIYDAVIEGKTIRFDSPDKKISKVFSLADTGTRIVAKYSVNPGLGERNIEFGLSPNVLDLAYKGKEPLESIGNAQSPFIGWKNKNGGAAFVEYGGTQYVFADDISGELTMALTGRVVVKGKGDFTLALGFDATRLVQPPYIPIAGNGGSAILSNAGGEATYTAFAAPHVQGMNITGVKAYFHGTEREIFTEPSFLFDLRDDGENGDAFAGDGVWSYKLEVPPVVPQGRYLISLQAHTDTGEKSAFWPFLQIGRHGAEGSLPIIYNVTANEPLPGVASDENADLRPRVAYGGFMLTSLDAELGGKLTVIARVENGWFGEPAGVELRIGGKSTGIFLQDDGTDGDAQADDGWYAKEIELSPVLAEGMYLLSIVATDTFGNQSDPWPWLTIK